MTHRPTTAESITISAGRLASGGPETHLRLLALQFRREGWRVAVYGTGSDWSAETIQSLKDAGVVFRLPAKVLQGRGRLSLLGSWFEWWLHPPRDSHVLYCVGAGRSHFRLQRMVPPGCPMIYHELVSPPGAQSLSARCIARADGAIANSQWVANAMAGHVPGRPLRTLPFLTAPGPIPPPARSHRSSQKEPLQVGYLGRLEERKRPHKLVEEWQRLTESSGVESAVLHLHGNDEGNGMLGRLRQQVAAAGMSERIHIHGGYEHRELSDIFSKLDLVVLPSEWEGLPLVLVEAMQHGIPFVATCAGGTAELAQDNPDVCVTGIGWEDFVAGFCGFVPRVNAGEIDPQRLHGWVESRYGFEAVWPQWRNALTDPGKFFGLRTD